MDMTGFEDFFMASKRCHFGGMGNQFLKKADIGSDHNLVIVKIRIKLQSKKCPASTSVSIIMLTN